MEQLSKLNLSIFLTQGASLKKLAESGTLIKEITPINALSEHFNQIFLFTYGTKDKELESNLKPNIKIINKPLPIPSKYYKYIYPFLFFNIIKKSNFFKTNQINGSESALIAKKINPKAKLIIRTGYTASLFDKQGGKNPSLNLKREKNAYKKCDLALVTSQADKDYIIENFSLPKEKIEIIANYVDTDLFKPMPSKKYENKIIFVGRFYNPEKNITSLIEALSGSEIELDIIGRLKNVSSIENIAKENKVKINFLGIIPNQKLPETLNKYKVFILPSLYEGMPKALLEAMSCELAVIATNVPGSREVIINNQNGIISDTTPESLREKINLLIKNPKLIDRLGKNARGYIIQNFALKTQIKKEIALYQNLLITGSTNQK